MYTNRADGFSRTRNRSGRVDGAGFAGFEIDGRLVVEFEAQLAAAMAASEPDPIAMPDVAAGDGGSLILEARLTATGVNAQFPIQPNVRRACRDNRSFGQLLTEAVWRVDGCEYELQ